MLLGLLPDTPFGNASRVCARDDPKTSRAPDPSTASSTTAKRPNGRPAVVAGMLSRTPSVVFAFVDLFDDLGAECIEIAGFARGNDTIIDHDCGIFPFGARVHDI